MPPKFPLEQEPHNPTSEPDQALDEVPYFEREREDVDMETVVQALHELRAYLQSQGIDVPKDDGNFFYNETAREELVAYCAAVAEYIRTEHVKDLVVVDRSARPLYVGVSEYMKQKYPDEERPGIFFINPKGFVSRETHHPAHAADIAEDASVKNDLRESPYDVRYISEVVADFVRTYPQLMRDKEQPILLFDTCIHTGNSIAPVVNVFKMLGFTDVRVGTVGPAEPMPGTEPALTPDFYITDTPPEMGCYPFSRDTLVYKTFNSVTTLPNRNQHDHAAGVALRHEIKDIMKAAIDAGRV